MRTQSDDGWMIQLWMIQLWWNRYNRIDCHTPVNLMRSNQEIRSQPPLPKSSLPRRLDEMVFSSLDWPTLQKTLPHSRG